MISSEVHVIIPSLSDPDKISCEINDMDIIEEISPVPGTGSRSVRSFLFIATRQVFVNGDSVAAAGFFP